MLILSFVILWQGTKVSTIERYNPNKSQFIPQYNAVVTWWRCGPTSYGMSKIRLRIQRNSWKSNWAVVAPCVRIPVIAKQPNDNALEVASLIVASKYRLILLPLFYTKSGSKEYSRRGKTIKYNYKDIHDNRKEAKVRRTIQYSYSYWSITQGLTCPIQPVHYTRTPRHTLALKTGDDWPVPKWTRLIVKGR